MSNADIEETAKASGWLDAYLDLRAGGLHWKKAAFAAWYNAPKRQRQPETQNALAKLLNYKSPQVFYKWQKAEWFRKLGLGELRERVLMMNLADVDRRTIQAAIEEDGSAGVQARKLFYEQLLTPTTRVEHSGPDGRPIRTEITNDDSEHRIASILSILSEAGAIPSPTEGDGDPETE